MGCVQIATICWAKMYVKVVFAFVFMLTIMLRNYNELLPFMQFKQKVTGTFIQMSTFVVFLIPKVPFSFHCNETIYRNDLLTIL